MSPRRPGDVRQVPTAAGPLWVDRWDRGISKKLRSTGEYEPETTAWLRRTAQPGMRIVDVGANIGYYTVLLGAAVGETGRILAVEPDPWNRELLERNVADNGFADRVVVVGAALTDREGTCQLHIDSTYWGVHSISAENLRSPDRRRTLEVPATTLEAAVARAGFERVDLLKIDAQGAEGAIMRGAGGVLGGTAEQTLLLELWPFGLRNCGSSADHVIAQLCDWRFTPSMLKKARGEVTAVPSTWNDVAAASSQLTGHASLNLVLTRNSAKTSSSG